MRVHSSLASFFVFLAFITVGSSLAAADGASPSPQSSTQTSPQPSPSPSSGPFDHLKWRSVGPAASGGRVAAVADSAGDPFLYYVGAAGGGVWKSANGGATWAPVFDKDGIAAIGAIAVAATDKNVVWVGTGEANPRNDVSYGNGVYKSSDGGKTWQHLGLDATRQIASIVIDPSNANHVLVGALGDIFRDSNDRGVYETTDGGKTWTQTLLPGPQSGISDLAMDPKNPMTVYAGAWQFRRMPWTFSSGGPDDGLYKSTDGSAGLAKRGIDPPTGDQSLRLALSDIGLGYIDELNAEGYARPSVRDLARLGEHGVSLSFVKDMAGFGYHFQNVTEFVRFRDHGVDGAYLRALASLGYKNISADEAVRVRDHGVDDDFIRGLQKYGYSGLSLDGLVRLRDHGVDSDFVAELRSVGYSNISTDDLVRLRDHGVDGDYVKKLAAHGYSHLSVTDLIRLRDNGI